MSGPGIVVAPLHRHFTPRHLDHVAAEMRQLGAPRIRGHFDEPSGCWLASEGTHRLRVAFALGIAPIMVGIGWWRSLAALGRARSAAIEYGYLFPFVRCA